MSDGWATDEHRIGRKPLLRRIWAPIGQRPIAPVQRRSAWRSLIGFVHPTAARTLFHLATSVSMPRLEAELAACARQAGAGPDKQIVLVLVGPCWSLSGQGGMPHNACACPTRCTCCSCRRMRLNSSLPSTSGHSPIRR
jgi:hypothetical protein